MTIWLIILLCGIATYTERGAFLFRAWTALRSLDWQRWLRCVPSVVLAALIAPALLGAGNWLAPETLDHLLAAGLAALVAWRFQNVLATVASGMGALWGLTWLPDLTISLSLPLGLVLLASAGLILMLLGSVLAWVRFTRSARQLGRKVTSSSAAVTVTQEKDRLLPEGAMPLPVRKPVGAHLHCLWCWCPLPVWALYCGHCGLPQQTPALAITQPLAAVTVRPEGSEQFSTANGARVERTNSLPTLAEAHGARPTRRLGTASLSEKGGERPDTRTGTTPRCFPAANHY